MDEGSIIGNGSRGYKTVDSGDTDDDLSLPVINYSDNLTINRELLEDLLRQMQYEKNFDPFTQVSAVGTNICYRKRHKNSI